MKRKLLATVSTIVVALIVILLFAAQIIRPSAIVIHGSLFVSDAGRSHGGFEYNADWNATLTVEGRSGMIRFILHSGLGDALQKHEYRVTEFVRDQEKISMRIDGQLVVLVWQEVDVVWDHAYDRYFVASWGSDSPIEEIRGTILPGIFPGLGENFYVELRLR